MHARAYNAVDGRQCIATEWCTVFKSFVVDVLVQYCEYSMLPDNGHHFFKT